VVISQEPERAFPYRETDHRDLRRKLALIVALSIIMSNNFQLHFWADRQVRIVTPPSMEDSLPQSLNFELEPGAETSETPCLTVEQLEPALRPSQSEPSAGPEVGFEEVAIDLLQAR
jgi:hypothetical protein